jgi:signal transduction histidine kinase
VAHVNSLIARLGQLRAGLQIHPAVTDLNALVNDAVQAVTGGENSSERGLVTNLRPLPPLLLDREQMLKVVANLVFNAREAVATDGEVRIETFQKNGGAILSVSDNGCGMPPEFLRRSLFQPFQTTKKNGLGIGLFQSKMIVEAHQGKIDVVSEPGRGTTFQIILPVQKVVS